MERVGNMEFSQRIQGGGTLVFFFFFFLKAGRKCFRQKLHQKRNYSFILRGGGVQNKEFLIWRFSKAEFYYEPEKSHPCNTVTGCVSGPAPSTSLFMVPGFSNIIQQRIVPSKKIK